MPSVVPSPPLAYKVCGPNNDEVVIPEQPEGIDVESDGSWTDGTWTITFSASEGFVVPDGTQTVYELALVQGRKLR